MTESYNNLFRSLDIGNIGQWTNKKNNVNDKKIDILLGLFNDFQKVIDKNKMSDLLLICGKKIKEIKF